MDRKLLFAMFAPCSVKARRLRENPGLRGGGAQHRNKLKSTGKACTDAVDTPEPNRHKALRVRQPDFRHGLRSACSEAWGDS